MAAPVTNVAVVGAGHWGPNLIRNFYDFDRSTVTWVIDRDEARLGQVRSRFPTVQTATDAAMALGDDVDAVVVATPTSTHYEIVKAALQAGKHVLVEKPLTGDAATSSELCELAEAQGVVLLVGHVFIYNAAVQRVKRYLDDGDLGTLYYLSMVRTNLGPIRMDVNASWDLASHDISIANHWLDSVPNSVAAIGGTWINQGIEDAVFLTLRYPGNVLVNLHVSWLNPRKAREITIVGERKMLTLDDMNLLEPIRVYDKQVTDDRVRPGFIDTFASFRASVRDGDITIPKVSSGEPLRTECEHFLDCIAGDARPMSGGDVGLAVVRVLEAAQRSMANGGQEEAVG